MTEVLKRIGSRISEEAEEAYFVGGCVRDFLLGSSGKDIDLALRGDTFTIGRILAREFGGHVFWLHQEESVVRVVLPREDGLQIDLCPLRGSLVEDLGARDLTINAMAIPAGDGLNEDATILDPLGGEADLKGRRIRFCAYRAPVDDPLRTLRALRFRWKLGFTMDQSTYARIRECIPLLRQVSVERVRDELFQMLAINQADEALAECLQLDITRWLVGKTPCNDKQRPERDAPAQVSWLIRHLEQGSMELNQVMAGEPTPPRRRRELLLWGAVLQALGEEVETKKATRYLALSNDECSLIIRAVAGANRLNDLINQWPVSGRERYRYFRSVSSAGPESILLNGAARGEWSDPHEALMEEALNRCLHPEPPLLSGCEVMRLLSLSPGPRVGALLNELEEARADGLVRTAKEAAEWIASQPH